MEKMPVSIVIPTWNAAKDVERVLHALKALDYDPFELIVVDNGVVNQETEQVVKEQQSFFSALRYLAFTKQLGYAGAVNEGAKAASYDLVAVLNNDNIPESGWLSPLVKEYLRMKEQGKEAIVTSLVHREGFLQPMEYGQNIYGRLVKMKKADERQVFHPDGSSFLFAKSFFGLPYDEDYFIYHEDMALGWRAWLQGAYVRMVPDSRALTFDGGSTRRIAYKTAFYTERNRWLNYFCFLSFSSLCKLMPLLCMDQLFKLLAGTNRKAKCDALFWLLTHPSAIREKRSAMQKLRVRKDEEILPLLSAKYKEGAYVWNAFLFAVTKILALPLSK